MAQRSATGSVAKAVFSALNVATLTGAVAGSTVTVTADAKQDLAAPFAVIQVAGENREDAMQQPGKTVMVQVHLYSDFPGMDELTAMHNAVVSLLHYQSLSVDNHELVASQYEEGYEVPAEEIAGVRRRHFIGQFRIDVRQTS
jgi:hypothetical protein